MTQRHPDNPRDLMDRLDRALPPGTGEIRASDADPLVDAARQLAQAPAPGLPGDAVDRIEAQLLARLAAASPTQSAGRSTKRRSVTPLLRMTLVACLVVLVVGVFGVAQASADSLPGDALYPIKRTIEGGRLVLVSSDHEAKLRVDLASRRVDEFQQLLAQDDVYPRALQEATEQLQEALHLLSAGHGNRDQLVPRITTLAQQGAALAVEALPNAPPGEQARLQAVLDDTAALQITLDDEIDAVEPVTTEEPATVTPTWTLTVTPSATPSMTPTPSATLTPTATRTVTPTPSATRTFLNTTPRPPSDEAIMPLVSIVTATPVAPSQPLSLATRTPPGHGATPGLGDNPPGQGGPNPGIGNDGNPPGQQDSAPGNSENAPGQQDGSPGNSENAPGQQDGSPGNSGNAPGQQDGSPGNSGNAPGQNRK